MRAKRNLVAVNESNHRQLLAIQRHCRKVKTVEPSIPFLVNCAIDLALPTLIHKFMHGKNES